MYINYYYYKIGIFTFKNVTYYTSFCCCHITNHWSERGEGKKPLLFMWNIGRTSSGWNPESYETKTRQKKNACLSWTLTALLFFDENLNTKMKHWNCFRRIKKSQEKKTKQKTVFDLEWWAHHSSGWNSE